MNKFAAGLAIVAAGALPAAAQDPGTVVATVNGTDITLGHMAAMRQDLPEQYDQLEPEVLYGSILEQLIQQQAVADAAGAPAPYVDLAMENQRRALLSSQLLAGRIESALTEDAVAAEYERLYGATEGQPQYDASHILVESEAEAQDLIARLDEGADFAELARAESTGPSGPQGGALGWFGPGEMVPAFDQAVQDMAPGDIAGPVETQFGWHVIRLNDRRENEAPALEDVRAEVERSLQEAAVTAAVEEIMEGTEVERPETEIDPAALADETILD